MNSRVATENPRGGVETLVSSSFAGGGKNPNSSGVISAAQAFQRKIVAAAVSSLLLISAPTIAADLTIDGLAIGSQDPTTALTTTTLPSSGEKVLLTNPTVSTTTHTLFDQDAGIDYTVSDTLLTIDATQLTKPADATIDIDAAAKGVYEFTLGGSTGNKLTLKADLKELQLQNGQTFTLVRNDGDPSSFTAVISGSGNLKTQGDMTLGATNTYTGTTEVETGTVTMGSDAAFGASTDLTVADTAAVDMNGKNLTLKKVAGTGTINVNNGKLTLNLTDTAADVTTKLSGSTGNVVITLAQNTDQVTFSNANNDFAGNLELAKGSVTLADNTKATLGKVFALKLASSDNAVDGVTMTVNDAATLKAVTTDDATLVFAMGDKALGAMGSPKLTVTSLSAEATGTTKVNVTQNTTASLTDTDVHWLEADDKADSQTLIEGAITGLNNIQVMLNGTEVVAGTPTVQNVNNEAGTEVAKATYDLKAIKTSSQVGLEKQLKSLELTDTTGDGLVVKPSDTASSDADFTLTTKLTGTGNVTFDANGKTIVVQPIIAEPNDYSGKTFVKNGKVETARENALGNTSELNVADTGKVAMKDNLKVGALVSVEGATVDLGGKTLTVGNQGTSTVTGALTGAGKLVLDHSDMTVSKANHGLTAAVDMNEATVKLEDVDALGNGKFKSTSTTATKLTLAKGGEFDNELDGAFELTVGDTATPADLSLTGNNTGLTGKVIFNNGSKLKVTRVAEKLGSAEVDTTNGELHVSDAAGEIANAIMGSGALHLTANGGETSFASTGQTGFTGSVHAQNVALKASGTKNQFQNADVNLGNAATYEADEVATVKSLKAETGSVLDFRGTVNPLTVTDTLSVGSGADVQVDLPAELTSAVLDQITGESVKLATVTTSVSVDANVKLNGVTGAQTHQAMVGSEAAKATYETALSGENNELAVTHKLTALELQAGKTLEVDASTSTNKDLSVAVSGTGNLNFKAGDAEFSSTNNTYRGTTTLTAGSLKLSGANALGQTNLLDVKAGKVTVAANQENVGSLKVATGAQVALDANQALTLNQGTSQIDGTLSGTGELVVKGGQLAANGANAAFAGTTTVKQDAVVSMTSADALGGTNATIANAGTVKLAQTGNADLQAKLEGAGNLEVDLGDVANTLALSNSGNAFTGRLQLKNAGFALEGNNTTTLTNATLETGSNAKVNVGVGEQAIGEAHLNGGELAFEKLTVGEASQTSTVKANKVVVDANNVTKVTVGSVAATAGALTGNVLDADNAGESDTLIKSDVVAGGLDNLQLQTALGEVTQDLTGATATWAFDDKLVRTADGIGVNRKLTTIDLTSDFEVDSSSATDTTLSAKLTGAGDVTFKGNKPVTLTNGANDYTGKTTLETTVVAGADQVLGQTSGLEIKANGQFDLNGKAQTVQDLRTAQANALRGDGQMTLKGTSTVEGANTGFTADTTLASGSATTLNHVDGLGSGKVNFEDASAKLTLQNLAAGSVYDNQLEGAGALVLDASDVTLTGANQGFSGGISFANDGQLHVTTPTSQLGSAEVNTTSGTLQLSTSGDLNLTNKVSGSGVVDVNTQGNSVKFTDADDFAGTLKLTKTAIDGAQHVNVLDDAKLELATGSQLTVQAGGQTVDSLKVDGSSTVKFTDQFAPGTDYTGKLEATNGLTLEAGAKVAVDRTSVESTKASNDANDDRNLLDQDVAGNAVTLATGSATVGDVTLVDHNGQAITNAVTTDITSNGVVVADGTYDYTVTGDANGLHVGYQLKEVAIRDGQTLELDTTGATDTDFSAKLTGKGGLAVKGDTVTLTHAQNTYEGETKVVDGNLVAQAVNALGKTSKVTVGAGKSLDITANQEHVGSLVADGTVDLANNATLRLNFGESLISSSADLKGASGTTLEINGGKLAVDGANTGFLGNTTLKSNALVTLNDVAGLGNDANATVSLDETSQLEMTLAGGADLQSKIVGNGTIVADVGTSADELKFSNTNNAFTGKLLLNEGALALAGDTSNNTKTLSGAVLETGAKAKVTVSDGSNQLGGLTLNGGEIGFGAIVLNGTDSAGFVDLQNAGELKILSDTTVDLTLSPAATLTDGGSELLTMDDGSHVALVKNASQTIDGVDKLKFTGTASQTTALTQSSHVVADAKWALDGTNTFATSNNGHDLVVNYKLEELNLKHTTDEEGLVVSTTNPDGEKLSAKLTGNGNIVFNGGRITVDHENDYIGKTYVKAGQVVAGADNALGQTSELNIKSGAQFDLAGHSQTVGNLITAGADALKSNGGKLTLTGTASKVVGANAQLNASIVLGDNSKTTLTDVLGLGTGSIAVGAGDDVLTLEGANGQFANHLTGSGGLTLTNGATVELTGNNAAFGGKVTASNGTTLTVNHDVAQHLGTGALHVDGTAHLTQSGDWTLQNALTGNGQVTISADKAGGDGTFALGSGVGTAFAGNLTLTEANMTLDDDASSEGKGNADALQNATLTLGTNGVAKVEKGNSSTGNLTMDGGTLAFAGSATPGVHQSETTPANPSTAEAHLAVKDLTLTSGKVQVDLSANVNPDYSGTNDSLTMQDILDKDQGSVTTTLVSASGTVTGSAGSLTLVDQNGNAVQPVETLKVQDEGGNVVADAEYGLGLTVKDQNLGLAYQLNKVNIHDNKTLTLKGNAPNDNELVAQLTGLGGLKVASGEITLSNAQNDYTGKTEVVGGATLVVGSDNALGHTSGLDNQGKVTSNGFDQTIYGSVDNAGVLEIANGNWTVNDEFRQTGSLVLTDNAALTVQGNATLGGTSTVTQSAMTVEGTATITGTTTLNEANLTLANGGTADAGTLVGTNANTLNFTGGEFRVLGANAGLTANSTINSGATLTLESSADAIGKDGQVAVSGTLNFKGANGDFTNTLTGAGNVNLTGTEVAFTKDNSGFTGVMMLDDTSNLKVTAVNQMGGEDATIKGTGLVTMTSDTALNVNQSLTGSVNIDKLGTGDLVMADQSLQSTGLIHMMGGTLRFGSPATRAGTTVAGSVELDAGTGMSGFGTIAGDLTIHHGATAFVSGDASVKSTVQAPQTLKVNGKTVNEGQLQIGHLDGPADGTIGSRFEAANYVSNDGTIVVNGLLNGDADSKVDTFKANVASGTGKLTVNTIDAAGLGATRNVNGITVAEFDDGTVDLSLTDEIKVNGLYYRLMKTDDGSRYYLSNQIQSAGTGVMTTSELMQPEAGARSALAYAADQAFDLSLHDHVGETYYIDQLTGEKHLTSLWMVQSGDWTHWRDKTGQLYNKGRVLTTQVGGDLITWGPTEKHRLSFGLVGGYANADFDTTSDLTGWHAKGKFDGYSLGAYLAWQNVAEDGPFGSVQLRWNSFRNEVAGDRLEKEKYTANGISASAEAGWNQQLLHMKLENGTSALWRVQPHVRVHWSNVSADAHVDASGQRFEMEGDGNVTLRLGAKTSITLAETHAPGVVDPGLTFYVEGNWIRNTGDYVTTVFNENGASSADLTANNLGEVRFGVEGQIDRNIQIWGDLHHRVGEQSFRSTGVMFGGKYVW